MKKVLVFVLSLSLILGSFGAAYAGSGPSDQRTEQRTVIASAASSTSGSAATVTKPAVSSPGSAADQKSFTDVADLNCQEAVGVLSNLGIVSGYQDGTYRPNMVVTRAEMASLIVKALGMDGYDGAAATFRDSKGHWAEKYIAYANNVGIIAGRSAEIFDPDTTVSYNEAATMLVKALGYNDSGLPGQWPTNYVAKAEELGIMDDVPTGASGANRGDCAIMLYQTLDQRIGKISRGVFEPTKVYKKGITDAFAAPGTMDFDTMYVRQGIVVLPEFIVKGDEDSLINLKNYQGASITAYQNADGDIVGISEVKTTFLTGKFKSDNEFKVKDVTYDIAGGAYDQGSVYHFSQGGTSPTVGGISLSSLGTVVEYTLAVDLSGKQIKRIYSTGRWATTTVKATSAMVSNIINGKKINATIKFREDDFGKIDNKEFVLLGVSTLSAIKTGNVLTYAADTENYVRKLAVGTEVVSGSVTKMNASNTKITVNGKVYEMYNGAAFDSATKVGSNLKLTLTYGGDVFEVEKAASNEKDLYGIVVELELGNSLSLGTGAKKPQVKLFTSAGTEKLFDLDAEQLVEDNYLAEEVMSGGAKKYVVTGTINAQLGENVAVRYDLNANGEIDELETVSSGKVKMIDNKKVSASGAVDGHAIASDAVLFISDRITSGGGMYTLAEDYFTTTKARLQNKTVTKGIYSLNDKEQIAMMVVESTTSSDDLFAVVNDFYSVSATEDSDAKYAVDVLLDGKPATYRSKEKLLSSIGPAGGLKLMKLKADGTIDSLNDIAETSDRKIRKITGSGITFLVENDRLKVASTQADRDGENYDVFNHILSSKVIIYVWDDKASEWVVGNVSDLDDMLDDDEEYLGIYELDYEDNPDMVTHVTLYRK